MKLFSFSLLTDQFKQQLDEDQENPVLALFVNSLSRKRKSCGNQVFLISIHNPREEPLAYFDDDPDLIKKLYKVWQNYLNYKGNNPCEREKLWQALKKFGKHFPTANNPLNHFIFQLFEDNNDHILKLSQSAFAQFSITHSQEVVLYIYPDDLYIPMFHFVSQMARDIPGYQLHFQKKPDLSQLIKEEGYA